MADPRYSISLVTGSEETRIALTKQLMEILGDFTTIHSYSLEHKVPGPLNDYLVILSTDMITEQVLPLVGESSHVVIAKRTIDFEQIEKLLSIPKGTRVLYVNDFDQMAFESIDNLIQLGVDHIEYIPYYPGIKNFARIPLAVTPGEASLVPEFVKEIIDVGPRLIDITTIMLILDKLGLLEEKAEHVSRKIMRKIIELSKILAQTSQAADKLSKHFKQVLDGVDDGIMAIDDSGRITVFNTVLENLLKLNSRFVLGKQVKEVLPNQQLLHFAMNETEEDNGCFTVMQNDYIVHRLRLDSEQTVVLTFKDVHGTIKIERTLRRELVKKGYVAKYDFDDIIGTSSALQQTKHIAKKLARTDLTVLIEGESGTGKELFASAIHNESIRNKETFLAINFSALSEDLIESELFGYEEGAFTGAKKGGKMGLFEQANGGTIFLDEIGDISLRLQARLLRVLQEKEIMRIGGNKIIPINVRVIAATNKDLLAMIEMGKFREDLYHRLKVLYLHLPELRRRKEDMELLIRHFIHHSGRSQVRIQPEVMSRLSSYEWYGNIRELKNTIDYMLAVCDDDVVTLQDIPEDSFFQKTAPGHRGSLVYRSTSLNGAPYHPTESGHTGIPSARAGAGGAPAGSPTPAPNDDELFWIMQTVHAFNRQGEPIGRKRLSELSELSEQGLRALSEQQIRHRVEWLEQQQLLAIYRGRSGIRLTPQGVGWLEAAAGDANRSRP